MIATDLQEVLRYFDGVKRCNDNQYMVRCPCHDDRKQSLSIGRGEKGVVLKCQAGCDTRDIIARVGLKPRDLFYDSEPPQKIRAEFVAVYTYPTGVQKLRKSDKSFAWRRPDGNGGWIYNRQGIPRSLYVAGDMSNNMIAVVEGEKDADNLHKLGYDAVSGEDGAGPGKWRKEYTEQLQGKNVTILQDNDAVGKAYAQETAAALHGVAKSVRLLDLAVAWPEIPEHGDVSDMIQSLGEDRAAELLVKLEREMPEWKPVVDDPFLSCFKTLSAFEEKEASWLVPGWIPQGQITLTAADGGVGKTSLWCNLVAAISSGRRCVLDPPGYQRKPQVVAFLTTEDSVRQKLKKKLRLAGANMENIITPDFAEDRDGVLRGLKFGFWRDGTVYPAVFGPPYASCPGSRIYPTGGQHGIPERYAGLYGPSGSAWRRDWHNIPCDLSHQQTQRGLGAGSYCRQRRPMGHFPFCADGRLHGRAGRSVPLQREKQLCGVA